MKRTTQVPFDLALWKERGYAPVYGDDRDITTWGGVRYGTEDAAQDTTLVYVVDPS